MEKQSGKYIFLFPIIVGTVCAYAILYIDNGGIKIMDGIVIALIGVAGAIVGVVMTGIFSYMQLKRDGKTINQIGDSTSRMDPTVQNINDNTKDSRDILIKNINPTLDTLEKKQNVFDSKLDKIDYVVKEFEYQNRLKKELSSGLNKDGIKAEIDSVYERNAMLERDVREKSSHISELVYRNQSLEQKNESLQNELEECKEELDQLRDSQKRDYGMSL